MSKLPQAIEMGKRPSLRSSRLVTSDKSGEIEAEGMQGLATSIANVAIGHIEREKKSIYSSGKMSYLISGVKERNALDDDPDWEGWEESYREKMLKHREAALSGVRSKSDRVRLEAELDLDMERNLLEISGQARLKDMQANRARLDQGIKNGLDAIYKSQDAGSRRAILDGINADINAVEADGDITADEALKRREAAAQTAAKGVVQMMEPGQRAKVLVKPEGTLAELITPPERKILLRQAQEEGRTERVRKKSQEHADRIMNKHGEDRTAAFAEARKIKGKAGSDAAAERDATIERLKSRYAEVDALDTEAHDDAVEYVSAFVEDDSNELADVDARQWEKLSVSEKAGAEKRYRDIREGIEPVNDDALYYDWTNLSQTDKLKVPLEVYRPYLDNAHYEAAVNEQQTLRDAIEGAEVVRAKARAKMVGSDTQKTMIDGALVSSGIFTKVPSLTTSKKTKARWMRIHEEINRRIVAEGADLPSAKQKIIDDMIKDRIFLQVWGTDEERIYSGADPADIREGKFTLPIAEVPIRRRTELENLALSNGLEPNDTQIASAYLAMEAGATAHEVYAILSD